MSDFKINNYAILAGDKYYPSGGFHDLYDTAETMDEAIDIYQEALVTGSKQGNEWFGKTPSNTPRDWAHIVCLKTLKIINSERLNEIRLQAAMRKEEANKKWREEIAKTYSRNGN
jgi:hypothetical protein